jgi:hypothetical protein
MSGRSRHLIAPRRTRLVVVASLLSLAVSGGVIVQQRLGEEGEDAAAACPTGSSHLSLEYLRELTGAAGADEGSDKGSDQGSDKGSDKGSDSDAELSTPCWKDGAPKPEPFREMMSANAGITSAMGLSSPRAMATATAQSARLAGSDMPGSAGTWTQVGDGKLDSTDTSYAPSGYGITQEAGRLSGYALGPEGTVYAAAANGGVWKSTDQGRKWSDISLGLPNQIVGAVGWSSAGGPLGTILALTGDNSFGQYNWSGTGLYYSTDEGAHWVKARGIPDGTLGFKVAVAPDTPTTVYAATGSGLFRSTDTGRTWTNVDLPTVAGCADHPFIERCALASVVTDVVVRGKDKFGHTGGAVVAAVGWRGGNTKNADGVVQAPNNGLYLSDTGAPGTFQKLADGSGFPATANVGRVSLGDAYGPDEDHDYLYALVQDAQLMQSGGVDLGVHPDDALDQVGLGGLVSGKITTYINGAYVSSDFGRTWTQIADTNQFINPASGSALVPLEALGTAPGVQSWYNNWIQPDPYAADPVLGAPTRLDLGLEEIWPGVPVVGPTALHVVAPYTGLTYACPLAGTPCGTVAQGAGLTSTHPDQHGFLFLPPAADGSRSVLATSDGGSYTATVPAAGPFKQTDFVAHQDGFNTLLPYGFGVSKDGTVVAGLQDNGSLIIHQGTGTANQIGPGDGGTATIDPNDSNVMIYSESVGSALVLNTNGGKETSTLTADTITPDVGAAYTYPQLRMDYAKPTRLIYGGQKIFVADAPMSTLTTNSWQQVYDLGSGKVASASDIYDGTAYVGWCGACETLTSKAVFGSGIATNYGGTWHLAAASGLPHRLINTVLVDHTNPEVVYVGLGGSTKRQAFHPGLTGADGVDAGGGYLYKSTDGGATFHDITGSLPAVGVLALQQYGHQLLVGSVLGAYISSDLDGSSYGRLGSGLPAVAVNQFQFRPGSPKELYVSTYGRGIYRTTLQDPVCAATPTSSVTSFLSTANRNTRLKEAGTTFESRACAKVTRVQVAVRWRDGKGRCRSLRADGTWSAQSAAACRMQWVGTASGTTSWSYTSPGRTAYAGWYDTWVRAVDSLGHVEPVGAAQKRVTRVR